MLAVPLSIFHHEMLPCRLHVIMWQAKYYVCLRRVTHFPKWADISKSKRFVID